ncbi:MAG: Spx/MgsR family RNA polymerase-binding regulatory protein [Hellea sp.]|nr:Spx/MgsR family RNA polymerase-binding regulatory protein [Hellea sp.]
MTLTIYHLKSCDTCRKAIKSLGAAGHDLTLVDVRADGMPKRVLSDLISDKSWEAVLNRRSTTWRGLPEADKSNLTDEKAAALIAAHPTLMKRPLIISEDQSTIGWRADVQDIWL